MGHLIDWKENNSIIAFIFKIVVIVSAGWAIKKMYWSSSKEALKNLIRDSENQVIAHKNKTEYFCFTGTKHVVEDSRHWIKADTSMQIKNFWRNEAFIGYLLFVFCAYFNCALADPGLFFDLASGSSLALVYCSKGGKPPSAISHGKNTLDGC